MPSIYDYPNLYDALFSDICRAETAFLTSAFARYCRKPTGAVFEPASGSGRLLYRLAKLGFDVSGLDLNPKSVDYCNKRLRRLGLPGEAVIGDMTDFSLTTLGRRKKFDLAFNFVSSFLLLTDDEKAQNHLRCVADVLQPDGVYLLGLHLKPQGRAACASENWAARRGRLSLKSKLRTLAEDKKTRTETIEFAVHAETPTKRYVLTDRFAMRTYSAGQFAELIRSNGRFCIEETYSFDHEPIQVNSRTEDVIFVLRN